MVNFTTFWPYVCLHGICLLSTSRHLSTVSDDGFVPPWCRRWPLSCRLQEPLSLLQIGAWQPDKRELLPSMNRCHYQCQHPGRRHAKRPSGQPSQLVGNVVFVGSRNRSNAISSKTSKKFRVLKLSQVNPIQRSVERREMMRSTRPRITAGTPLVEKT